MKKLLFAALVGLGFLAAATPAQAQVPAFGQGPSAFGANAPINNRSLLFPLFRKQPMPAFQAAPWYLYWPYNGHFMTPAPMGGAWYGPNGGMGDIYGGGMVNPYFGQQGTYIK